MVCSNDELDLFYGNVSFGNKGFYFGKVKTMHYLKI